MPRPFVPALFVLLLALHAFADTDADKKQAEQTQHQLDAARKDIDDLQKLLKQIEQEKSRVQKQLEHTESDMGTLEQQIRELKQQIDGDSTALKQLGEQQNRLQQSSAAQRQQLARYSRAVWQEGQAAPLRLLLSGQPPDELSRTLTYYSYLSQARQREIGKLRDTLAQIDGIRVQITERKAQLDAQDGELQSRHEQLAALREERSKLLATLGGQQQSRAAKLKARQKEQAELALVLQALQATLAQQAESEAKARAALLEQAKAQQALSAQQAKLLPANFEAMQNRPFAQTRGKLPWPVAGKLLASYGSPRGSDARVRWDGVLIGAAEGSAVRAIHPGQVVLAEYLSGMGLMLIINHGNQYLSLYGHNQSLLKHVGDLVKAGEPIATVGSSGGQAFPALYFAIRHQKTPSDPAQWCMAQK